MGLLDEMRSGAAATAADSAFVRIETRAVEGYARSLVLDGPGTGELDAATHYLGEADATLAYFVTLDAINFGSGYFPGLRKRAGLSGYFTLASRLKDWFIEHGPFGAADLLALTLQDCALIFGQDLDDDAIAELMGLFSRALNDLGAFVSRGYGGSFVALVESADGSAEQLASRLTGMPFYQDVGFFKRAQLTAADLALAGVARFDDLDRLTMFADNLVPHVLRVDGVLSYTPGLLERIEREELIPSGSTEEQEIRACALHAVELIGDTLRRDGRPVTSMQLDNILWNRGQAPTYKARPRHRTRTVFY